MTEVNHTPQLEVKKFELGIIETNLNELEAYVNESLTKYKGLVYTDDQIKDAKVDRRNLNNLGKAINDWRIRQEREFNEPFAKVKEQCNRVVGRIKETSGEIDSQVKAYEQIQKDQKQERITAYWNEIKIHDIPIDMVFDPKWLNVTCSEKEWKTALDRRKERISMDLASFANYADAKMCEFMITEYMKTLDVQVCLDRWNEQVEAERRAEEAKARAEAIRLAREEETRKRAEMAAQKAAEEVRPEPQEDPAPQEAPDPRDFLYSPTFGLEILNQVQTAELISYFKDQGLNYSFLEPRFKMIDLTYYQAMDLTNYFKKNGLKFMSISKEKRRK